MKKSIEVPKHSNICIKNLHVLEQMYYINSYSEHEHGLSGFVRYHLNTMGIDYQTDQYHQIYSIHNRNQPLFVAHLDQTGSEVLSKLTYKDGILSGDTNLGADDKNGVWISLELLRDNPDINFIFSTQEEIGGQISSILEQNSRAIKSLPFGIVLDRKNGGDIIGVNNGYCSEEFEDEIHKHLKPYGFNPCMGIYSDADALSNYLNCVNISIGYYNGHQDDEYTDVSELVKTLQACKYLLKSSLMAQKFEVLFQIRDTRDLSYKESFENDYGYDYSDYLDYQDSGYDDYICPDCKDDLTVLSKINDIELMECRSCGYRSDGSGDFVL